MGIFIYLNISKSTTAEEWEKVYDEVIRAADKMNFVETRTVPIHGIQTRCLVTSSSMVRPHGLFWKRPEEYIVWRTCGDGDTLRTAEAYDLDRYLIEPEQILEEETDAILYDASYQIWGTKTQAEPYHFYLLGLACLIEARLGVKAFTFGDITYGQCKTAVEIINEYLEEPISLPDSCDADRFARRIKQIPNQTVTDKIELLRRYYLGPEDASFGEAMRRHFSKEELSEYWKERFRDVELDGRHVSIAMQEYLNWGFDLSMLPDVVTFQSDEDKDPYKEFIESLMRTRMYRKEKNSKDPLEIDRTDAGAYSIWTLLAQVAFGGIKNQKVDRYIPLDEIRTVLNEKIGDLCDVGKIMEEALDAEFKENQELLAKNAEQCKNSGIEINATDDAADVFTKVMDKKVDSMQEVRQKYDITETRDLLFFTAGKSVEPNLQKFIADARRTMDSWQLSENYSELQRLLSAEEKCRWLVKRNRYLWLTEKHWDNIFTDVEQHADAFGRYYSAMCAKINDNQILDLITALVINDEFYAYSGELAADMAAQEDEQ